MGMTGKASSAPSEASASAADDSANKDANETDMDRYNPYAGIDPNDPNAVSISKEEFRAMMQKKKTMGIPPLRVLQEKSKQRNAAPNKDGLEFQNESVVAPDLKPIEKHEEIPEEPEGEETSENIPPPPPHLRRFLRMQKAGVPNEAILQLARVQGVTSDEQNTRLLGQLLGVSVDDDENDSGGSRVDRQEASNSPRGAVPPRFRKFLKMKKQGIPKEAILQKARIQGFDCTELKGWLSSSSHSNSDDPISRDFTVRNAASDGEIDQNLQRQKKAEPFHLKKDSSGQPKKTKYIKMRMKGIEIPYILEFASNDGVTETEIPELEAILAEVGPVKRTRTIIATHKAFDTSTGSISKSSPASTCHFTPIKNANDSGAETENAHEKIVFHHAGTSVLASLVRKMVHTVDKTSRSRSRRESNRKHRSETKVDIGDDDMVINSKTLYQALGSFQGVQYARDAYNETMVTTPGTHQESMKKNIGWLRAKRQSFQEIAKSIGLNLRLSQASSIDGLDALIDYIEDLYKEDIQESISLLQNSKLYDFDSLSALYVPGSRVVAKSIASGGIDMICRVSWNRIKSGITITGKESKQFEVCFEFVVAVGSNQATIAEVVEGIDQFEGRRNIFSRGPDGLTFIPWMAYNQEEQKSLLERYRRRGRIYNEVALNCPRTSNHSSIPSSSSRSTFSYKAYRKGCFFVKRNGFGGSTSPSVTARGMATGGRIVVDTQGAYDYGNSLNIGYDPMITGIQYKMKEYKLHQSRFASGDGGSTKVDGNKFIVDAAGNSYSTSSRVSIQATSGTGDDDSGGMVLFDAIPDDYLEMVWPCVLGFSLTAKAWGDCLVDGLEDIQFSDDIFDRLVLPDNRKRLIKALVKNSSHVSSAGGGIRQSKYNFQDLVAGKGEGSVFLLYGPPGVGKTLTAEAVAEILKRPLYALSMGTLGTTADDLEQRLGEILKLAAKWDAIILLDEADSFLEKRSSASSLERNAMVCVMLQLVEYFSGILFLTSNRMDSLDPAFQTRITLSLPYHNLSRDGRQQIWKNLLQKSGVQNVQDGEGEVFGDSINTKKLAKYPLNGREIKNALRLALALAAEEDCVLTNKLLMETSAMVKSVTDDSGDTYPFLSRAIAFLFGWIGALVFFLYFSQLYDNTKNLK